MGSLANLASIVTAAISLSGAGQDQNVDLTELSIEDLMRMDVSVASRRSQPFQDIPAAAFVITEEDIRRSSATSIPELLRGGPGLHVGQIDNSKWMVSARGFNGRFANKLLVLIDGRSVYTPLFSGTWWSLIDLPIEEIERIEIVRGTGGSLWGTNAVNGTINIITKHSATTLGTHANLETGTRDIANAYFGVGDTVDDNGFWRFYGSGRKVLESTTSLGFKAGDDWTDYRFGGRYDFNVSDSESATFDFSFANLNQGATLIIPIFDPPYGEVQHRDRHAIYYAARLAWQRDLGEKGADAVQVYFDRSDLSNPESDTDRSTFNAEFNSTRAIGNGHEITFGAGYKTSSDQTESTFLTSLDPASATMQFWSGFIGDQFEIAPKLTADLRVKFETSTLANMEALPTARLLYKPDQKTSYWISSSHAIGTPSRYEEAANTLIFIAPTPGLPVSYYIVGSDDRKPEKVDSLEAGVRVKKSDNLFIDVAAFYNRYYDLRTYELGGQTIVTDPVLHIRQDLEFGNKLNAETAGLEMSADWRLENNARLTASYSIFSEKFRFDPDSTDFLTTSGSERAGITPKHQLTVRASLPVNDGATIELDMYSVGALAWSGWGDYFRLDAQYKAQLQPGLQLTAGVKNLFADGHLEGRGGLYDVVSEIPTQAFMNLSWRF